VPWDSDSAADEYIDYLAEHESGFMGGIPVRLIGMEDALRSLTHSVGGSIETIGDAPRRFSTTRRRRQTTMAKKNKAPKVSKAEKKALRAEARTSKKVAKLQKRIDGIRTKADKKVAGLQKKMDKLKDAAVKGGGEKADKKKGKK
jgi:hypothetical protein